jgi:superfamily II DNA or RNA helicase
MKIDQRKLERQLIGVDRWFNSSKHGSSKDKRGVLHYPTGVGKTYVAILIIKKLFEIDSKHNIVIIVPANIQNQWKSFLDEHLLKRELEYITIYTPHAIINSEIKIQTNTLIVDEIHECYSEELIKVVDRTYIRYDNNLGLTGTYKDSKNRHKFLQVLFPIIDVISEQEAIREGYISPYLEFNLGVTLTAREKEVYQEYSDTIAECMSKFPQGTQLDLASKILSGGKHANGKVYDGKQFAYGYAFSKGWRRDMDLTVDTNNRINDLWNPHKIFGYAVNLLNSIRKRKDLLYNAENKVKVCLDICERFKDLKTIIFSQSTAFADKVDLLLNEREQGISVVYHSNLETILLPSPKTNKLIKFGGTRLKRRAIDRIKSGESRIICTASSLDKGLDIADMGLGLTASGTSNFTQYKQRGGRAKRRDMFNANKVALLINLYVKDSQEERWLDKRQSEATNDIYIVDSIDEITFTPTETVDISINDI